MPESTEPGRDRCALVKVGGGLLAREGALMRVGAALSIAAREHPLVVVPGGGPFADQVRQFQATHGLSAESAHWMAILGMDQYAFALADHVPGGRVVEDAAGIRLAHAQARIPILAPYRWLRAADELPHAWDVTGDSLAAYLATLLGIHLLLLIKPVAGGAELLDPWFARTAPAGMRWLVLSVDQLDRLCPALREHLG